MRGLFRPAFLLLLFLTFLTGVVYPLAVTGLARIIFPRQAGGSLIVSEGRTLGSALVGQPFDDPRYFWGRPSATASFPYNALASGGSNLGPSNPELAKSVGARVAALRAAYPENGRPVPAGLVTASGSGLDPHISPAAAFYQAPRVAKARGLDEEAVIKLVSIHIRGRDFGVLGEPVVPVLELNMALETFR